MYVMNVCTLVRNGLAYSDDALSSIVKENTECWSKVAKKRTMLWRTRNKGRWREERERERERVEEHTT